jgi:hypothetical protein
MWKSFISTCWFTILILTTPLFSQEEIDSPSSSVAEYEPLHRFGLVFGLYLPTFTSEAQITSQTLGLGPSVNLEKSFQLPKNETLLRIQAFFRFNKHHSIYAAYYKSSREGTSEVTEEIQIGNLIIPAKDQAYTKNDISLLKFGYRFSIINTEDIESGLGLGFSVLFYKLFIESKSKENTEDVDEILPIPVFNFYTVYNIWNRLDLSVYFDLFGVNLGAYEGSLSDFGIGLSYRIFNNFGAGIDYNVYKLDVHVERSDGFNGVVDYLHKGIAIYLFYGL